MTIAEVISDLNFTIADLETIQLATKNNESALMELIRAVGQLKAARAALVRFAAIRQRRSDGPR